MPPLPIQLTKLQPSDLSELVLLSRSTFSISYSSMNTPENMAQYMNHAFSKEQLLAELNSPDSEFYFAYSNTDIVGYLKINFKEAQTEFKETKGLEVERIYVVKNFQGQQIGKRLINFTLQTAKEKKLDYIWLGVWDKNIKAIEFYKKNGFEISGTHSFLLGDELQTDYIMRLSVQ